MMMMTIGDCNFKVKEKMKSNFIKSNYQYSIINLYIQFNLNNTPKQSSFCFCFKQIDEFQFNHEIDIT